MAPALNHPSLQDQTLVALLQHLGAELHQWGFFLHPNTRECDCCHPTLAHPWPGASLQCGSPKVIPTQQQGHGTGTREPLRHSFMPRLYNKQASKKCDCKRGFFRVGRNSSC